MTSTATNATATTTTSTFTALTETLSSPITGLLLAALAAAGNNETRAVALILTSPQFHGAGVKQVLDHCQSLRAMPEGVKTISPMREIVCVALAVIEGYHILQLQKMRGASPLQDIRVEDVPADVQKIFAAYAAEKGVKSFSAAFQGRRWKYEDGKISPA